MILPHPDGTRNAEESTPARKSGDNLVILSHSRISVAKTLLSNGKAEASAAAKYFHRRTAHVRDIREVSALLVGLENQPRSCVIRGAYIGDELAALHDPECKPGMTRRSKSSFIDQPLHTLLVDVDKFVPTKADPVTEPAGAIDEYVLSRLPSAFHFVSYHWQLSGSAGLAHNAKTLKAHVWFWLATPYTSAQLRAWAESLDIDLDKALLDPIQIHYTAAPVREAGVPDPVPLRSGFSEGLAGDEVRLVIDTATLTARPERTSVPAKARSASDVAPGDGNLRYLERTGQLAFIDAEGRAHVKHCPFESEHGPGAASETGTTYLPAGVGKYEQGHWHCMHDHCHGRTDGDFDEATGYNIEGFEDLGPTLLSPLFERDRSGIAILATAPNLAMAIQRSDICGRRIAYDRFLDDLQIEPHDTTEPAWASFYDTDFFDLQLDLEKGGFKPIGRQLLRDAVYSVAKRNAFDSAQVWLNGRPWDGVPRVERFWSTHFKAADTAYTRAVARYTWTAMAGRVLVPGVQADMVPVLIGRQGCRKSTGVRAMSPYPEAFAELSLDIHDDNLARKMRGKLVAELAELRGLQGKDSEAIKQWITRSEEEWTPKYMERTTRFKRRLLMLGTTNNAEFLSDDNGEHRRWLPIVVGVDAYVDTAGIARDCEQLWAEGAVMFKARGVEFADAERLAREVHSDHLARDPWEAAISRWLGEPGFGDDDGKPKGARFFRMNDLLTSALGIGTAQLARTHELRAARILRSMGYDKLQLRVAASHALHVGGRSDKQWLWGDAKNRALGQLALNADCNGIA